MAKRKGQTKSESPQEQDFNIDALYTFPPEVETKLQATIQYLGESEQDAVKGMQECPKGSVEWHICALWARTYKNEKDDYKTISMLLRSLFFLLGQTEKKVDVLARKKFKGFARQLLNDITKREEETKKRWIKGNLGEKKQ